MTGLKILLIRVFVMITIITASFGVVWYLYGRVVQLNQERRDNSWHTTEVNAPRLNHEKVKFISDEFQKRKIYLPSDTATISIPENDPFYQ
jgi:hypothetical protein